MDCGSMGDGITIAVRCGGIGTYCLLFGTKQKAPNKD